MIVAKLTSMPADPIEHLRGDPALQSLIEEHGRLSIEPADDFFERFVTSIIRQQLSMESAAATRDRLFDAIEVTPAGVIEADAESLRAAGLSKQKIRYLRNLGTAFRERGYRREHFDDMPDEEVIAELTAITGVGEWTARMQLIFSLGRPDVFPVGDLGIRKGMWALFDGELTHPEMVERAERWAPYRSYASQYLWRIGDE